ncbi:MAG: glycoside hydrolase family 3 C-terminal domain-containing protein [Clostridia bacterium]|nr:glycoside hydrolase family 3 C-terminal domain-containing protein [Clostridia bacterium]
MKNNRSICFGMMVLLCIIFTLSSMAFTVDDGADVSFSAASEAMVLLKNESNALPLTSSDKIAVFGEGQIFTDGKTGGFFLMGRGSGYFVLTEDSQKQSPCDLLAAYVDSGNLGGVYTPLMESYKSAAVKGEDFSYSPTDEEYASASAYANKAIYVINRSSQEAVALDESVYDLTKKEKTELLKVCAAFEGKPVIVVINAGLSMNMGFANGRIEGISVDAVITAPYMGTRGVDVFCKTLVGEINPSGKTADTYAKSISDYPSYESFYESRDYVNYYEDIYVGYRYFETFNVDVDYPFGYGLSYTTFDISDVTYSEADGKITVTAKVTNMGDVAGKEVLQVYFGAPQKGTNGAVLSKASKELCGFAKTSLLAPGASETLSVTFDIDSMASYDDLGATGNKSAYVMEAGDYIVYVGNSVRNTVVAGTHTEDTLRIVEQLTQLCEPTAEFERMTFDGTETIGKEFADNKEILHKNTHIAPVYFEKPQKFSDVLSGDITVKEFVGQMSNAELCEIAVASQAFATGAFGGTQDVAEKYGIPLADTADGPAGLRITTGGTGIPGATAIACTWNKEIPAALGDVVGREALKSDVDIWLSPGVNIHRFPLCSRNFEYFSEDPYLTGVMASAIITSVENHGVATSVKHFVGNERENARSNMSSNISERALREIYLVPFNMAVDAGVSTVMSSYNKLNGTETAEHAELLRGILRGEWGFEGVITTDWTNNSQLVKEIVAGNNVKASTLLKHLDNSTLINAVKKGEISRSLLVENAEYMMNLLARLPAAKRLQQPTVTAVSSSAETKFEAEDYTLKHAYTRFEEASFGIVMSYTRATEDYTPWLEYTLDVEKAGSYILSVNMANRSNVKTGDALRVFVNGEEQQMTYQATSTGGWSTPALKEVGRVDLPSGKVTLKVKCNDGAYCGNFDYFTLIPIEKSYTAITSADELLALMGDTSMWSGKYYLANDIDLTGIAAQGPIGTNAKKFTGVFDGMGYSIRGLSLSTSTEQDFGLFGKITGSTVRDLTVYGEVISTKEGNAVVGGIVGTMDPGSFVVGCTSHVNVTYNNTAKAAKGVGGVVGYMYGGTTNIGTVVKNCINYGTVTSNSGGNDAVVGGITGIANDNGADVCEIKNCVNYGDVSGQGIKVGGIVGYLTQVAKGGGIELSYCANYGDITSTKGSIGGIVGFVYSLCATEGKEPNVSFCINNGSVSTDVGYESGGVIGFNAGANMDNCVNLGTLTANDGADMGGVVGRTYTTTTKLVFEIKNCYTVNGEVVPTANYEKPAYFTFTHCGVTTEERLISKDSTLTYGDEGYQVIENKLLLATFAPEYVRGDVDGDGDITLLDALLALKHVLNDGGYLPAFDINSNGTVGLLDVLTLFKLLIW